MNRSEGDEDVEIRMWDVRRGRGGRTRENAAGYSPGRDVDATFSVWLMIGHIPFASTSSPSLPSSSSSQPPPPFPSSTLFPVDVKHAADVIVSRQISLSKAPPDGNGDDEERRERERKGKKIRSDTRGRGLLFERRWKGWGRGVISPWNSGYIGLKSREARWIE